MASIGDISKITLANGDEYDIKDAQARADIAELESYTDYLGVTTTELTDGATTNPITINGESVEVKKGNIVNYGSKEFIFNGTAWQEFGDLSGLGDLAFEDTAEGQFTPHGTVSQPTASVAGSGTATVNSITNVGTLPTATVTGETLVFTAGTLPTKGEDVSVLTSVGTITVTQPTFTGTEETVTVSAPTP